MIRLSEEGNAMLVTCPVRDYKNKQDLFPPKANGYDTGQDESATRCSGRYNPDNLGCQEFSPGGVCASAIEM